MMKRWLAFGFSLVGHLAAIGLLLWTEWALRPDNPQALHYQVRIIPKKLSQKDKIVWYDFRQSLPEVRPDQAVSANKPQGEKDPSNRILIIQSPDASSRRQLIRQPEHQNPLPADVPAPNLVALRATSPIAVPAPPPKAFTPPPLSPKRQTSPTPANPIEVPPALDAQVIQSRNDLGALTSATKLPPKLFVPPVARGRGGAVAAPGEMAAPPAAGAESGPPSPLQAVIIGLDPAAGLPPQGSRSAQFSKAPDPGTHPGGTSTQPDAPIVSGVLSSGPGVLSRGRPGISTEPVPPAIQLSRDLSTSREVVLPGVNRTMSAPLRPSSRVIPATVESQFAHRNVYALVIPGPNVPGYRRDWVMWFAERQPNDSSARIVAPVPARKFSSGEPAVDSTASATTLTVQFAAIVDKNGRVLSARILRGATDESGRRRALEELDSWEFKPAMRNGEPMDVDVVVEIPLQLAPLVENLR